MSTVETPSIGVGLTAAEVAQRIASGQVNRPPDVGWTEYRAIAARNVLTLFNALVVPAAIALFYLKEYPPAWAVSALAIINSLVGIVQEVRAKRHLDQLALLTHPTARVLRDGAESTIPADDVVVGDAVLLRPGDTVVADGTVLFARFFEVDEALLTGESDPVARQPGERLLSGSVCVAGDATYRVDKVGGESFVQQTSAQARRYQYVPSPMQSTLDTIIRILTAIAVILCLMYVVLYHVREFDEAELVKMIAATVTSMVPQGLVLMTTLAFSLGAVRMSLRGALVQRLNAVESMASVDVLCMDKTGTLTTSRLRLDQVRPLQGDENEVRGRLQRFAWASIDVGNKSIQAIRDALGTLPSKVELLEQIPFKSQNRYSAVRIRTESQEEILVMGAFEVLQSAMQPEQVQQAEAIFRELLPTGLRLLLFAEATPARTLDGTLEGLTLSALGLIALSDELRPEAGDILEALAAQGIRFKILSGDNPETVHATVGHLRLPLAHEPVATGDQLASADNPAAFICEHSVFGRVSPQQKLDIIDTLQEEGSHVGMVGDGVNDILAIKRSDLGIAMGAGSSATKTVAGLVLENNNFGLLPATLDEGRVILCNLRRAAKLFLLKNVYTLFLILVGTAALGLEFPYLPQQVTLLNALTIGGPAFVIMLGRITGMSRVASVRQDFLREVGWFVIWAGLVMGITGLTVWLLGKSMGEEPQTRRTLLLSTLILIGLGNVVLTAERDVRLYWWAALALPLYLTIMYSGDLPYFKKSAAYFFDLSALSVGQWLFVAIASAVVLPLIAAGIHMIGKWNQRPLQESKSSER